jgi:hypothetical protein
MIAKTLKIKDKTAIALKTFKNFCRNLKVSMTHSTVIRNKKVKLIRPKILFSFTKAKEKNRIINDQNRCS